MMSYYLMGLSKGEQTSGNPVTSLRHLEKETLISLPIALIPLMNTNLILEL